ncbi:MAG: L,D-transpeptidase [Akkermansiaceae bacterium]
MKNPAVILTCLTALATLALHSCSSSLSGGSGVAAYEAYNRPATLPSNPSAVKVKVSLQNQMVYVMEGSKPLLVMPVSVGKASTPTPRGSFTIYSKEAKRRANTHGYATNGSVIKQCKLSAKPAGWGFKGTPMPYWCEFKPAYGFHTGWVKHTPCTHGCIRMHQNVAPKFFRLVSNGTPVNISYSQPEDASIGKNVPRPIDAGPLPDYPINFMMNGGYFTKHKTPTFN